MTQFHKGGIHISTDRVNEYLDRIISVTGYELNNLRHFTMKTEEFNVLEFKRQDEKELNTLKLFLEDDELEELRILLNKNKEQNDQ